MDNIVIIILLAIIIGISVLFFKFAKAVVDTIIKILRFVVKKITSL